MARDELLALAERVEREPADFRLWLDAFKAAQPANAGVTNSQHIRFDTLLRAGAYLDAADMLRPETAIIDMIVYGETCVIVTMVDKRSGMHMLGASEVKNGPAAEARARLAAALRAIAQQEGK